MEFKVKKDFLPIFITNLVLLFVLIVPTIAFASWLGYLIIFDVIIASIIVLYNTSLIFTSCRLENNTLTYQAGLFKYVIDLKSITKVTSEKNIHFSLAQSSDRIRILTKNKENKQKVYYISVCDKANLISLLKPTKNVEPTPAKVEEVKAEEKVAETSETKATPKKPAAKKSTATKKATTTKKTTSKSTATKKTSTAKSAAAKTTKKSEK